MGALNKIFGELRNLMVFRESDRKWQIPLMTALCVGAPLLLGLYFDNLASAITASLSGMVILYLPARGSLTNSISTLMISSFGFMAAFTIGQVFSFVRISAVIAFGLFSMAVHWIILYYKTAPPSSFFFIFIAALSICQPFDLDGIPAKVGLMGLGLMFSSLVALGYLWNQSTKVDWSKVPKPRPILDRKSV